jgi:replicative DNA helicase
MNQRPPKSKITDATLDSLRVPPHSIEAEQSVLGGLLLDNQAWDRIGDLVTDGDFYRAVRDIFLLGFDSHAASNLTKNSRPTSANGRAVTVM